MEQLVQHIIRTSFTDSSLRIDNYEPSLYMGTVQAYIQGLEQGSITKNCTFIDIRGTSYYFWENNILKQKQMVTYQALNGKYYTHVTIIEGDIYGTGPKTITFAVYESTIAFGTTRFWISLTVKTGLLIIFVVRGFGWFSLGVGGGTLTTLVGLSVSSDMAGVIMSTMGWALKGLTIAQNEPQITQLLGRLGSFLKFTGSSPVAAILGFAALWLALYGIGNLIGAEYLHLSGTRLLMFSAGFACLGTGAIIFIGACAGWEWFGFPLALGGPVVWAIVILIGIGLLLWYFVFG